MVTYGSSHSPIFRPRPSHPAGMRSAYLRQSHTHRCLPRMPSCRCTVRPYWAEARHLPCRLLFLCCQLLVPQTFGTLSRLERHLWPSSSVDGSSREVQWRCRAMSLSHSDSLQATAEHGQQAHCDGKDTYRMLYGLICGDPLFGIHGKTCFDKIFCSRADILPIAVIYQESQYNSCRRILRTKFNFAALCLGCQCFRIVRSEWSVSTQPVENESRCFAR